MRRPAATLSSAWVRHDGKGRPVPLGTCVDIRHFNGDVTRNYVIGSGVTFDMDGSKIDQSRARWSGWKFDDGGPSGPKFKEYRIAEREQTMAALRSLLTAPLKSVEA